MDLLEGLMCAPGRFVRRTLVRSRAAHCAAVVTSLLATAIPLAAQSDVGGTSLSGIDGSARPVLPEVITRDDRGRPTILAIRLDGPLDLDGRLDEALYQDYQPFGDFIQVAPVAGAASSERTDVWISFDENNLYVTCRCWDEAPPEQWVSNELRRDADGIRNNEHFGVMLDTFYDRRNGGALYANPLGARNDYSIANEGSPNRNWNPVWQVAGGEFDGGWIVEMAIPFKSLRYNAGPDEMFGLQLRRSIRHKNEWTYLSPVPAAYAGPQGLNRVSDAGTLVGLELPPAGNNLELKPYGISSVTTDRLATPSVSNDVSGDVGLDLKYGITANLTADVTFNTDFAQVEVDEQQVNLTRFSLFFPEKRDFFLEGSGSFTFGEGGQGGFRPGGGRGFGRGGGDRPTLFYSRRIGLEQGSVVPIQAGGRVTGKVGSATIGALSIRTGGVGTTVDPTTYSVLRVRQDIFGRSSVGALFTDRSLDAGGVGRNRAYGVDGQFAFLRFLTLGAYWAQTEAVGTGPSNDSWQVASNWNGDLVGASASRLSVGADFDPGIGFLRRSDFVKSAASARYSPRPESIDAIRKLTWEVSVDHFDNGAGFLQSRRQSGRFDIEMENSDQYAFEAIREFEWIETPFPITNSLDIQAGRYAFQSYRLSATPGAQRRLSGGVSFQWGDFYDGSLRALSANRGRLVVNDHLSLEPGLTVNWIDLPMGQATQAVFRLRADYAFTPLMFVSSLLQYNESDRLLSTNLRFRWEFAPGSDLFVVWTDERQTGPMGTGLRNRGLTIKATRLFRY